MRHSEQTKTRGAGRGVNLWAWGISIGLHICVIGAFAAVKFSAQPEAREHPIPTAAIASEQKIPFDEPLLPKPKLKTLFAKTSFAQTDAVSVPVVVQPDSIVPQIIEEKKRNENLSDAEYANLSPKAEFFGSETSDRKICYVVDCSGSMKPVFRHVQDKLRKSINALAADQFFVVVFFGNERIKQFPADGLVRASMKNKCSAIEVIDTIQAAGVTNAADAIEKSLAIGGVQTIFFLTDGFELEGQGAFDSKIESLAVKTHSGVKINTIGFWPQQRDMELLELIAKQTGGEFIFVTD